MSEALDRVQETLGHRFSDPTLLQQALTHRSFAHENDTHDSERLEFLGDAILQACTTHLLHERFADAQEGTLSRFRARLVNTETLADIARSLHLGPALRLGRGEAATGGDDRTSNLADATESVLGALYVDAGFGRCLEVVSGWMEEHVVNLHAAAEEHGAGDAVKDARSRLQELTQSVWREAPQYAVVDQTGPSHAPTFEVEVRVRGQLMGQASGNSKREAAHKAAAMALDALSEISEGEE